MAFKLGQIVYVLAKREISAKLAEALEYDEFYGLLRAVKVQFPPKSYYEVESHVYTSALLQKYAICDIYENIDAAELEAFKKNLDN